MKSAKAKRPTKSLQRLRYKGELTVDGEKIPISFYASAGADCRLVVKLDPLPATVYIKIVATGGRPGTTVRMLGLSGSSTSGHSLKSDRLAVTGHRSGTRGFYVFVEVQTAEVTIPLSEPQLTPGLCLFLRSFKSFRNPVVETPLGKLIVQGATQVTDVDMISGSVALLASASTVPESWFGEADAFLEHMRHGLAFAHGGRLQVPRVDRLFGSVCISTYYSGSGFQSEFPIQHSLHHAPIIGALVNRYFQDGPLPEHLWTALGWMQIETTFDEVRFLTGMTALESILENVLPARKGTTISKTDFTPLKKELTDTIQGHPKLSDEARSVFIRMIAGLNRRTFAQKIDSLFAHLGISRRDLDKPVIAAMIKLRNEIVHRGAFPPGTDIWANIILIREIIVRIILTELGFVGRYQCYIDGGHDRDFPDATPSP